MYSNIHLWTQQNNWPHIADEATFLQQALRVFHYQYAQNALYRQFADSLGRTPEQVSQLEDIPFLPVSFFKNHQVLSAPYQPDMLFFESSGTTGRQNSRHYLADPSLYTRSFNYTFRQFYGPPSDYVFLCLLPSYLERQHASLVYMADALIKESGHVESGFFLHESATLANKLLQLKEKDKQVLLLGVTFALLDFAEAYPMDLSGIIVMETGGMKGRKEEWTRHQVHHFLAEQWQLEQVHAEYGMTELLSQAYADREGRFRCPGHMKVLLRDPNDPFEFHRKGSGLINVIDLANIHSCAFIATDDIGRLHSDNSFEVLGRTDHSALRGCSLMAV